MREQKNQLRREMLKAMTAAYQEHLDEAAQDPAIRTEKWDDFFSCYGPAPDNDDLIDYFKRRASGVAQDASEKETGDLSQ